MNSTAPEQKAGPAAERGPGRLAVIVLVVADLAASLFGAWCYRFDTGVDSAITALQAKHIAEGTEFPVFFYGQEANGSMESMSSAVFCLLLGNSWFAVALGATFLGLLVLPMVFALARRLGGMNAACAALAFLVVGPRVYFKYHSHNLGYAKIVLFSTMTLWAAVALIERWREKRELSSGWLFALGLAVGLGWWASQLTVGAALAAAIAMLLFIRWRLLSLKLAAGAAGFFLGGAPWWVWNLLNDWQSFKLARSLSVAGAAEGARRVFAISLPQVLWIQVFPLVVQAVAVAIWGLALVWAVAGLFSAAARRSTSAGSAAGTPTLAVLLIFVPVSVAILCFTTFGQGGANRYSLPLIPVLAVLLGGATAWLVRRIGFAGWIPLAFLITLQLPVLPDCLDKATAGREQHRRAAALRDVMRREGVDAVYSGLLDRWLNFALDEEFCFWTTGAGLRYRPYWERIEATTNPAVLDGHQEVSNFLACAGGSCETREVEGYVLHLRFKPPEATLVEIPPEAWSASVDLRGQGMPLESVRDRVWSTAWANDPAVPEARCDVEFTEPRGGRREVSAVRVFFQGTERPDRWRLYGSDEGADWTPLTEEMTPASFYWCGDRLYAEGVHYRLECRFAPRRLAKLRIALRWEGRSEAWAVSELQLFGPGRPLPEGRADVLELAEWLSSNSVTDVYCDRWVGNRLRAGGKTRAVVHAEPYVSDSRDTSYDASVAFARGAAIVTRTEDAPMTRQAVDVARLPRDQTAIGPWTVFTPGTNEWADAYAGVRSLRWVGVGCVLQSNRRLAADWIVVAHALHEKGQTVQAAELFRKAIRLTPDRLPASAVPPACLRLAGYEDDAQRLEESARIGTAANARFANGVELAGVTLDTTNTVPGGQVAVRYFWKFPGGGRPEGCRAFVHFASGTERFQDDHDVMPLEPDYQPSETLFVEERVVAVPRDAPAGEYRVLAGMVDPRTGKRLRVRADCPIEERAALLPVTVRVKR